MILISNLNNISEKYKNLYKYIILTDTIKDINAVYSNIDQYSDFVHSVILRSAAPVIFSGIKKEFGKIPLVVFSRELGSKKLFLKNTESYKIQNVKYYLSSALKENFFSVKMISSLGINTGIYFDEQIEWDFMYELIEYSVKNGKTNAELQPLSFIINNYKNKEIDYNDVYFNDPLKYLYINKEDYIFLNYRNFIENKPFAAISNDSFQSVMDKIALHIENEKKLLLADLNECSSCAAWKICLGKFSYINDKKNTCSKCFSLLIDNLLNSQ